MTQNQKLREALQVAHKALEAISDDMTVGDRWTNAGQYLLDALEPVREALALPATEPRVTVEMWEQLRDMLAKLKESDDYLKSVTKQFGLDEPEKRPQNCGTGHCSCIECLYQPSQPVGELPHGANWPAHHVIVGGAALQMVRNALKNDVERGLKVRGEMLAELDAVTYDARSAIAQAAAPKMVALTAQQAQALAICIEAGHVCISLVQRRLAISWNSARAACQAIINAGYTVGLEISTQLQGIGQPVGGEKE